MQPQPPPPPSATLLFYHSDGHSLLDRLIAWFSRSGWVHVALLLDGSVYEELGQGLVWHGGQDARDVAGAAGAYATLPLSAAGHAAMLAFCRDILAHHGAYAFDQLVLDAAGRAGLVIANDGDGSRYVCSGFCGAALVAGGYRFNRDVRALSPADLAACFAPLSPGAPR